MSEASTTRIIHILNNTIMAKYIIKNNLPTEHLKHVQNFGSKEDAKKSFLFTFQVFSALHPCKMVLRDEKGMNLRGTIQIELNGFFYYVELYKEG